MSVYLSIVHYSRYFSHRNEDYIQLQILLVGRVKLIKYILAQCDGVLGGPMANFMPTTSDNGPSERVFESLYELVCGQFWLSALSLRCYRSSLGLSKLHLFLSFFVLRTWTDGERGLSSISIVEYVFAYILGG